MSYPWVRIHEAVSAPLDDFPGLVPWEQVIGAPPAVQRASGLGESIKAGRSFDATA